MLFGFHFGFFSNFQFSLVFFLSSFSFRHLTSSSHNPFFFILSLLSVVCCDLTQTQSVFCRTLHETFSARFKTCFSFV